MYIATLIFFCFIWWSLISYLETKESEKTIKQELIVIFFKNEADRKEYWESIQTLYRKLCLKNDFREKYVVRSYPSIVKFKLLSDEICGETIDFVCFYDCELEDCINEETKLTLTTLFKDRIIFFKSEK